MCTALSPQSQRLIPAWAGKTFCVVVWLVAHRAHPRVGGENAVLSRYSTAIFGSSPRGRGKRIRLCIGMRFTRLIPAWAGKTATSCAKCPPITAHPRVGGENNADLIPSLYTVGSSPRGRGKPRLWSTVLQPLGSSPRGRGKLICPLHPTCQVRLIPAWAGKTAGVGLAPDRRGAHPRVGGENRDPARPLVRTIGSSPRGRGKYH